MALPLANSSTKLVQVRNLLPELILYLFHPIAANHSSDFGSVRVDRWCLREEGLEVHPVRDLLLERTIIRQAAAAVRLRAALTRTLTRSPAFRQWYYQDVQRLLDVMTPEAQELALRNAAEDPVLSRACRRSLRSPPRHPVQHRRLGRAFRRGR